MGQIGCMLLHCIWQTVVTSPDLTKYIWQTLGVMRSFTQTVLPLCEIRRSSKMQKLVWECAFHGNRAKYLPDAVSPKRKGLNRRPHEGTSRGLCIIPGQHSIKPYLFWRGQVWRTAQSLLQRVDGLVDQEKEAPSRSEQLQVLSGLAPVQLPYYRKILETEFRIRGSI